MVVLGGPLFGLSREFGDVEQFQIVFNLFTNFFYISLVSKIGFLPLGFIEFHNPKIFIFENGETMREKKEWRIYLWG